MWLMNQSSKTICPICQEKRVVGLPGIKGYYFCPDCKTAWLKKFPNSNYSADYYQGSSGLAAKLFSPIAALLHKLREEYAGSGVKKIWIDVGAGEGNFLKTVSAKRKIGVEVSNSGRKLMEKSGLEILSNQQFLKTRGLNASVISLWHVLEHMEKPWIYLQSVKNNLDKKGQVIIGVPNADSFEFKFFKENWFHLAPQFHLWHFSPKSIELMVEKNGLEVSKIDYWSPEHQIAGLLQSFLNKFTKSKNILHQLIRRGTEQLKIPLTDCLWIIFWLTFGLPVVFLVWVLQSLSRKSGTFVVVASLKR